MSYVNGTLTYGHNYIQLSVNFSSDGDIEAYKAQVFMDGTIYNTENFSRTRNRTVEYTFENLTPETTYYNIGCTFFADDFHLDGYSMYEITMDWAETTTLPESTGVPSPEVIQHYLHSYDAFWLAWSKYPTSVIDRYEVKVYDINNNLIKEAEILNNDIDYDIKYYVSGLQPNSTYKAYIHSYKDLQSSGGWGFADIKTIGKLNTPTISEYTGYGSFDEKIYVNVSSNGTSERAFVECEELNFNPVITDYSKDTLDHLYKTSVTYYDENGQWNRGNHLTFRAWDITKSIDAVVYFQSTISSTDRNDWYSHIQYLLDQIKHYTGLSVTVLSKTWSGSLGSEDWTIAVGDEPMLDAVGQSMRNKGYSGVYNFQGNNYWGLWNTWSSGGYLTKAMSRVSTESNVNETYTKATLTEEIMQCMGAGHDTYDRADSIHHELVTLRLLYLNKIDQDLLDIIYKGGLPTDISGEKIASLLSVSSSRNKTLSSNSNTIVEVNNLKSNTTYRVRAWTGVQNTSNNNLTSESPKTSWIYITTANLKPQIPTPPTITSRIEGGYNLSWGSVDNATMYTLKVRRGYDNYTKYINTTSTTYQLDGLQYGVSYLLSVYASNSNGRSDYSPESIGTTAPFTPSDITFSNITDNSFRVSINNMIGNWDFINVALYNGSNYLKTEKIYKSDANYYVDFTGLTKNVEHTVRTRSYFTIHSQTLSSINQGVASVITTARPENWKWTSANDINGYKVSGSVSPFLTALEWNNFTERINQFRSYRGLLDYTFTTLYAGNDFTANVLNQAINAINEMKSTGLPIRKTRDECLASDFNTLMITLNSL